MSDLLAADFARLLKSQVFHGMLLFCVECLMFEVIMGKFNDALSKAYLYDLMNTNFIIFGILLAIFIGLFIGSEYSDGTIRNKIIAGNSRTAIYLSNFIITVVAGFIMQVIFLILPRVFLPMLFAKADRERKYIRTEFLPSMSYIFQRQLVGLYIILAYTAIFLLIAMLLNSRSGATAAVMVTAILIFAAGMTVHNSLADYDPNEPVDEEETVISEFDIIQTPVLFGGPPKKLKGPKLKLYLFLDEFLPSAQSQEVDANKFTEKAPKYVMYDVGVTAVMTSLGMVLYRKKDLK
ncbi:MAG: ABC transporter permease subunit [Clostridia bacterium]|nr:ABC transporter permease subunit [Clostridia bacterium]